MSDLIAGISVLVKVALTSLLCDAGQSTKSGPHPVLIEAIQTVVYRAVAKALQTTSFQTVVEQAVHNMVLEPHILNAIATRIIDSLAFTAPAKMFVKNQVEKDSLKQTKMENRYRSMVNVVEKTRPSSSRHGSSRPVSLPTDISYE